MGKSRAIELMVTGNTFSFEEAKELGIINDIYERDGFMENIMEYARQFCPPNKAAKAVGRIKRAVQTGWEIPMESALAVERENQQILFQSDDAKGRVGRIRGEASGHLYGEIRRVAPAIAGSREGVLALTNLLSRVGQ